MKKKLAITLICILAVFLIFFFIVWSAFWRAPKLNGVLAIDKDNHTLTTTADQIKILQLTDVQFENYVEASIAIRAIDKVVKKANPDMIVFTGDMIDNHARKRPLASFAKYMDKFGVPWAVTLGNHDYHAPIDMEVQCEIYENTEFGLFEKGTVQGFHGNYNYNVVKDGQIVQTLFFMDSGIDGFTSAHVEWYNNTVDAVKSQNLGNKVGSFMFYHIPTEEARSVAEKGSKPFKDEDGVLWEQVNAQETESEIFKAIKNSGFTTSIFFGHDHLNNAFLDYRGVKMCYGLKTGTNSYSNQDLQGGNLITLNIGGKTLIERIYV
ncbi:MAG: metallophosphoesterase [Clostridia bacterium]|nr:metallophosphoesterase [Clostridia bacterium]